MKGHVTFLAFNSYITKKSSCINTCFFKNHIYKAKMIITGTIVFKEFSGGFWGIEGNDGKEYLPTEMPEALKKIGQKVKLDAKNAEDYFSIYMWGTPIEILGFELVQ